MEDACYSKTSADFLWITKRCIPGDRTLNLVTGIMITHCLVKVSAHITGRRVWWYGGNLAWSAQRIPTAVNFGFLYRSRYFSPHPNKKKYFKTCYAGLEAGIPQSVQRRTTGWTARFRFLVVARTRDFLFYTAPRPALGPRQPPIQWVPRALSPGERGRIVKLTTHIYLVPRSGIIKLYLHSPIRLHDVVLNELSAGTILPLLTKAPASVAYCPFLIYSLSCIYDDVKST
jgi:hypothetical protein